MSKKKGGSSRVKVWKRRFLVGGAVVFVLLLIVARSQHASTDGVAGPAATGSASPSAQPKLGLVVQRAPVCLGDMGAQEYYVRVRVANTGNVTETVRLTVQSGYAIKPEWVKMGGDVSLDPQKSQVVQGSLILPSGVQPGLVDGQLLVTASAPEVPARALAATVAMRGRVGGGVPPC